MPHLTIFVLLLLLGLLGSCFFLWVGGRICIRKLSIPSELAPIGGTFRPSGKAVYSAGRR